MKTFAGHFWDRRLADVFADQTPVPLEDARLDFLNRPRDGFLLYSRERERLPFDGIPPDEKTFKQNPTFFMTQVHRLWIMVDTLRRQMNLAPDAAVADLGAFPFSLDIALREYLSFEGRILAIVNQEMKPEWLQAAASRRILVDYANLDPYVEPSLPGLPTVLPAQDGSVDTILFTHVIEHLYHPLHVLRECHRILKPGGRLLLSTDNAYLLGAFLNFLDPKSYLHEPVEGTAAMIFSTWRGHVRFYTEGDLHTMCAAAGLKVIDSRLYEVLYNAFLDDYFVAPQTEIPAWRVNLLSEFPVYRNEIVVVVEKSVV